VQTDAGLAATMVFWLAVLMEHGTVDKMAASMVRLTDVKKDSWTAAW